MFGALNNEVAGSHTEAEWQALVEAWGWRCFYCGKPIHENPESILDALTKDHLVPISRGGSDNIGNLVPACFNCNRLKGMMTIEEFRRERPVFFTDVQNSRRKSTGVNGLGCGQATKNHERSVQTSDFLPPEPRVTPPTTGRELLAEWKLYTEKLLKMNDGYPKERDANWYQNRRSQLRVQAQGMRRIQSEAAGQMRLPLNLADSPKPPQSDETARRDQSNEQREARR
jgi:hypothetical protein